MNCPFCGKPLHENDHFCSWCGREVTRRRRLQFHMPSGAQMVFILSVCAAAVLVMLVLPHGEMPKGTYGLYDENGTLCAALTLRSDGTYVLDDRQDYAAYAADGNRPLVVFAHEFAIGAGGLSWDPEEKGKLHASGQEHVYEIPSFLGGLFDEKKDVCLLDAGSVVYLYDPDSADGTAWIMSRLS